MATKKSKLPHVSAASPYVAGSSRASGGDDTRQRAKARRSSASGHVRRAFDRFGADDRWEMIRSNEPNSKPDVIQRQVRGLKVTHNYMTTALNTGY